MSFLNALISYLLAVEGSIWSFLKANTTEEFEGAVCAWNELRLELINSSLHDISNGLMGAESPQTCDAGARFSRALHENLMGILDRPETPSRYCQLDVRIDTLRRDMISWGPGQSNNPNEFRSHHSFLTAKRLLNESRSVRMVLARLGAFLGVEMEAQTSPVMRENEEEGIIAPAAATPAQLRPDEFDFGGRVMTGFTARQIDLLRFVRDAGNDGALLTALLENLGYKNSEKGRKALDALRRRTQEVMDDQKPSVGYLLETVNNHLCLTRNAR